MEYKWTHFLYAFDEDLTLSEAKEKFDKIVEVKGKQETTKLYKAWMERKGHKLIKDEGVM